MSELKRLHKDAIPAALEKAERYRLLNEPGEAESICLDILHVDPENHHTVVGVDRPFRERIRGQRYADERTTGTAQIGIRAGLLFWDRGGTSRKNETAAEHAGLSVSSVRPFA